MPELPEVEVTRRGIAPHLEGRRIEAVVVREGRLRWPVPEALARCLPGQAVTAVRRRAKYLQLDTAAGTLWIHLGMSGSLRILTRTAPPGRHDHVDLVCGGVTLRYNDPRRFGAWLWQAAGTPPPLPGGADHGLGLEPFDPAFTGAHFYAATRTRSAPVKQVLLAGDVVVGVGNIYASEALFRAGIHPARGASGGRAMSGWRGRSGTCWERPSPRAAARCGISWTAGESRGISSSRTRCTDARANPACAAARPSACCARASVPPGIVRAASASGCAGP